MIDDELPKLADKFWNDLVLAQFLLQKCAELGFPLPNLLDRDEEAVQRAESMLEFVRLCAHGLEHEENPKWPVKPYDLSASR